MAEQRLGIIMNGVTAAQIDTMLRDNPARLLGL